MDELNFTQPILNLDLFSKNSKVYIDWSKRGNNIFNW